MGSTEKFCLCWNDFESNISTAFQELREDKDFFDVTLACDDDQIQGHKVILSACSPFFRSILRRNRHEHPLLYLKGVKYADLVSVLNFMYHGEVNVAQEELNSFLAVAEDLKIKGLTQNDSESKKTKIPQDIRKQKNKEPLNQLSPLKHPRSLAQVPRAPVVSSNLHQPLHDDVQEILPVKSESISIPTEEPASNTFPLTEEQSYTSEPSQHEAQEGVVADPDMEYGEEYGEGYGDYGENYGGPEGGYELAGGTENKGKDLSFILVTFVHFLKHLVSAELIF